MIFNVYIGFDTREKIASDVCEFSIKKNSTIKININLLNKKKLERDKILYRENDNLSSTEFTFSRFLVPYLNNYKGWALFCDCDFLWLNDIKYLFNNIDDKYAVMCVKHDYTPSSQTKMDGRKQLLYPRKNWSSMVLWNCGHPNNKKIDIETVNNQTGKYLHRFGWLDDDLIGEIDYSWNWLVGWYVQNKDRKPNAVHFTEGGPWFQKYKNCEFSDLWRKYQQEMQFLNENKI
jgi:lipopolysaccharide biosynthesis glycosyltransferase